jgi:hypothetical protein
VSPLVWISGASAGVAAGVVDTAVQAEIWGTDETGHGVERS